MPELPEVESVRRGVDEWTAGARVTAAEVVDPRILGTTSARRIDEATAAAFAERVTGASITGAERRGKFMWLTLDGDAGPLIHLAMSGQRASTSPPMRRTGTRVPCSASNAVRNPMT